MSAFFPVVAFLVTFAAVFWSLGRGFVAMLAVGYICGVIRANYLGLYTTFMFDAGVLGLYLGFLVKRSQEGQAERSAAVPFVVFLIAWPALLTLLPINHYLVQLVALRATVWYLPVLLVALRLRAPDLVLMTRGLAILNLVALAGGVYLFRYGIETLYPMNPVTVIIYKSNDVTGANKFHRIPSFFLSAHAYGGTMLLTLPLLVGRLAAPRVRLLERLLAAAGVVAAVGGIVICGARTPVALLAAAGLVAWGLSRFSISLGLGMAIVLWGAIEFASTNERFQRAASLTDTKVVADRVAFSGNASFLDLLFDYPMGAGMGSAVGTNIPYFLAHLAPKAVGMENEYARILIDQGCVGLGGWLAFVVWLFIRPPPRRASPWRLTLLLMYSLCLIHWLTAFMGAGMLVAVPLAVLLLTQMGVLAAVRGRGVAPGTIRPRRQRVRSPRVAPPGMVWGPGGCWLPATGRRPLTTDHPDGDGQQNVG
jgi:hypothetical protein